MVAEVVDRGFVSPGQRREGLRNIGNREAVANFYVQRGDIGLARKNYLEAAEHCDGIGDSDRAAELRGKAEKLGKKYAPLESSRVNFFNLDSFPQSVAHCSAIILGACFLSSQITGNVIGSSANSGMSVIGVILIFFGVGGLYVAFGKKKKRYVSRI
ncbi:MAG: hypothetical protein WCI72_04775 [archaeon]